MAIKWSDPQNVYCLIPTIEIIVIEWLQTLHSSDFAGT